MKNINLNTKKISDNTEKSFKINVKKEKKFLTTISKKLTREICVPIIEDDLKSILKSKTITLNNMQELFTYLHDAEYSNTHYFDTVKEFILNTKMNAIDAIILTEQIKEENDYMMSIMCNYFLNIDNGEVA